MFKGAVNCQLCVASMMYEWMSMGHWWNDTDRGKPNYWEQNCPTATSIITSFTGTGVRSNPGLRCEVSCSSTFCPFTKVLFAHFIHFLTPNITFRSPAAVSVLPVTSEPAMLALEWKPLIIHFLCSFFCIMNSSWFAFMSFTNPKITVVCVVPCVCVGLRHLSIDRYMHITKVHSKFHNEV
jgi:hypothetical protein